MRNLDNFIDCIVGAFFYAAIGLWIGAYFHSPPIGACIGACVGACATAVVLWMEG